MTQDAQLCWRKTSGKTPVPPCPTTVQGFRGEASGQTPSQGCALVSRAQQSPTGTLSCTMALVVLFTKLPGSSSATSEWDVQKQDPHSTACVPPWHPHHLLTRICATFKKPEGNLHTPPFPQGKQWCKRVGQGQSPLHADQPSSLPGSTKKDGFFPPLIAKTIKNSAGQEKMKTRNLRQFQEK